MTILYLNFTKNIHARDAVYLNGLKENGVKIIECIDSTPGWGKYKRLYKEIKKRNNNYDFVMVGYTGHVLVPLAKLASQKPIIFNALASLYEGIIISRSQASKLSFKSLYVWLIDFISFRLSKIVLVESNAQRIFLSKKFLLPPQKFLVTWTGVDENEFKYNPEIKKISDFTVLFRGGFLPESGIEYAIEAAEILKGEDVKFRILGSGQMENLVKQKLNSFDSKNVEWIKEKLPMKELITKMQECHLSLGQLSNHDRLKRTIPHKAFESLALKLPYLTARNEGVMELLEENKTCLACNPADPHDLAKKILWVKTHKTEVEKITETGYDLLHIKLSPCILAKKLLNNLDVK
ncbi:MAG: hypothetical protein COV29_02065 [Candidatus Yanofskybacteria bacterium CG10_big_fil_rev_8_21_14_0_10_36_16]|uniref:Glycosyl transferase family 1 domain-containing protein n=1 Tax=Candidatus Yanofskybacteria bacterium CG10_big_fil_rev_8_21_14_0_10_36_16 TaxID=1975096 RepID=A0A2J0QAB2_9BACT|nr:MAG: hypothetical protein COV29_02065 [Candidatus Yanofskybacteria bacterium CG10_big_fil_rev_8_21_14_0_10_36_16]